MRHLERLTRAQLVQLASYLSDMCDAEIFDPFTDEQLRLLITNKAIECAISSARI